MLHCARLTFPGWPAWHWRWAKLGCEVWCSTMVWFSLVGLVSQTRSRQCRAKMPGIVFCSCSRKDAQSSFLFALSLELSWIFYSSVEKNTLAWTKLTHGISFFVHLYSNFLWCRIVIHSDDFLWFPGAVPRLADGIVILRIADEAEHDQDSSQRDFPGPIFSRWELWGKVPFRCWNRRRATWPNRHCWQRHQL